MRFANDLLLLVFSERVFNINLIVFETNAGNVGLRINSKLTYKLRNDLQQCML